MVAEGLQDGHMWEVSGRLLKNLEVSLLGMMGNVDCQLDWTWHHMEDSLLRDCEGFFRWAQPRKKDTP